MMKYAWNDAHWRACMYIDKKKKKKRKESIGFLLLISIFNVISGNAVEQQGLIIIKRARAELVDQVICGYRWR